MSCVIKLFSPYNFSPVKQRCDEDFNKKLLFGVLTTWFLVLSTKRNNYGNEKRDSISHDKAAARFSGI